MSGGIPVSRVLLRSVGFQEDGSVVLEYCIPSQDARENGVILNHVMAVPYGGDYSDEIDAVTNAVIALIDDVLEDLPNLEPMRLSRQQDDNTADDDDSEDDDDDDDD